MGEPELSKEERTIVALYRSGKLILEVDRLVESAKICLYQEDVKGVDQALEKLKGLLNGKRN